MAWLSHVGPYRFIFVDDIENAVPHLKQCSSSKRLRHSFGKTVHVEIVCKEVTNIARLISDHVAGSLEDHVCMLTVQLDSIVTVP